LPIVFLRPLGLRLLKEKSMKGLEGRPLVGVRMASIPPAKIPISTLKSRFTFGLRPPLLKKVPHTKQALGIFRICSTNRRLALVSGLGQPQHRSRHPHRETLYEVFLDTPVVPESGR
ncbi:hypothetical protein RJ838_20820, partial [Pseudomonas aeruginosa]|uniref:hypothetical protein n=2 Tax=Pseudomonas aeruginosa TaxID=287 RepID=UPI0030155D68